ncbi:hypothetical protein ES702_01864 [subsurface metagenome]
MKVLHDWDTLKIEGGWARSRGVSLLCYWFARRFTFLQKIRWLRRNFESVRAEQLRYMETLIKLNRIVGVHGIYGIRDQIKELHGKEIEELKAKYGAEIRRHVHIGKNSDPKRTRTWDPPLTQSPESWHFDLNWAKGKNVKLKPGELAIFHVDRPHYLRHYIDYLFEMNET